MYVCKKKAVRPFRNGRNVSYALGKIKKLQQQTF